MSRDSTDEAAVIPTEPADAELLRRVAGGEIDALGKLYDRHARGLYSLARHILNDSAEAEDVVHEVFITLQKSAAVYDAARGSVFTWAAALIRNRAIDRLRLRRRRGDLLAQAAPIDLGYAEHTGDSADPFRPGEVALAIRKAVGRLPVDQRRALELAYFGGLTQQEIATQLAAPLGTIKARIRRGLLSLRSIVEVRP